MQLTEAQKELLLHIGGADDELRPIAVEVQGELVALGLVYQRDDGPMDLTDLGEEIYAQLSGCRGL